MRSAPTVLALTALVPACSLLFEYPDLGRESGEDDCHNEVDDDRDGLVDCDDHSCGRCVAYPRIECPDGWDVAPIAGEPARIRMCTPRTTPFDDCPSVPPSGALVVDTSTTVTDAICAGTGHCDAAEVWLTPGWHTESFIQPDCCGFSGIVHGLCRGDEHAVVTVTGTTTAPRSPMSLTLHHLDVRLGDGFAFGLDTTLDRSTVTQDDGAPDQPIVVSAIRDRLTITGSDVRVRLEVDNADRLVVSDSRLGDVLGRVARIVLTRTEVAGRLDIASPVSTLDLTDVLVTGSIGVGAGTLTGHRVTFATHDAGPPLFVDAVMDDRSRVELSDILIAPPAVAEANGPVFVRADVTIERLYSTGATGYGLFLEPATAVLRDITLRAVRGGDGFVAAQGSTVLVERMRVEGAERTGVLIDRAIVPPATPSVLSRVYVDRVPADPCAPTPCAEPHAGVIVGGGNTVELRDLWIDRVAGCGVAIAPDATITTLDGTVRGSEFGLCAPLRVGVEELLAGLRLEDDGVASTTDAALCSVVGCTFP